MTIKVEVIWDDSICQWSEKLSEDRIAQAVQAAAAERGFSKGTIGVRLTDDQGIHNINVKHLGHDYPTDVISFPYDCDAAESRIEGELIASVDTAVENAADENTVDAPWDTVDELTLYIVHGVLHISGMEDHAEADRAEMRTAESKVLNVLGITS